MKTGFFRALYGSCAGISIFEQLKQQSFVRACWHLLLMSLLSAVIIGIGIYSGIKLTVHNSLAVVVENCGSIVCTEKSVTPSLAPEKARTFVLGGPFAITYLPKDAANLPDDFQKGCNYGLLWSADGRFLFWGAAGGNKYTAVSAALFPAEHTIVAGKDNLFAELKKIPLVKLELNPGEKEELTPAKMQAVADLLLNIGVCVFLLRKTLLEVIIYIAMFAVVTLLMNMNRPRRTPFRELIVLAIYAGFPPMLIGSLAEALQLPYLSFNMIYVLGMTFYLIVIMNRLERLRQEKQWREEGQ